MARILIFDDERINAVVMAKAFEKTQHQVRAETNYRRAFALIPALDYAIVDWVLASDPDGHTDTRVLIRECLESGVPVMIRSTKFDNNAFIDLKAFIRETVPVYEIDRLLDLPIVQDAKGEGIIKDFEAFQKRLGKVSTPEQEN